MDRNRKMKAKMSHTTLYDYLFKGTVERNSSDYASADIVELKAAKKMARPWLRLNEKELRTFIPPNGAFFSCRTEYWNCPHCDFSGGGGYGKPARADFSLPNFHFCCLGCDMIFPNMDYYDPGGGWTNASGRTFQILSVGHARWCATLNCEVLPVLVWLHLFALNKQLSLEAGCRALIILDELARLSPTTGMPIDYPEWEPGSAEGRLWLPFYQVGRQVPFWANCYNALYDLMSNGEPPQSCIAGRSIKENIEYGLLLDSAEYCYRKAHEKSVHPLHNGQADYILGAGIVGFTLGSEFVSGSEENRLCRLYREALLNGPSSIFSMLENNIGTDGLYYENAPQYSACAKRIYDQVASFLGKQGIDISDNVKYRNFDHRAQQAYTVLGHPVCMGDSEPASLRALVDDAESFEENKSDFEKSRLFASKGIAILEFKNLCGAFIRYGSWNNHGHLDSLGLSIFDRQREWTYDLGYTSGSVPVVAGWSKLTSAHNLVVVDEGNQKKSTGGQLLGFEKTPLFSYMSAQDMGAYEGVDAYCRSVAIVGIDKESAYVVDCFDVQGGDRHDWMFHACGKLEFSNATEGKFIQGSLAGEKIDYGSRVRGDGYIEGEAINQDYWNPSPGNGYGFLMNPCVITSRHSTLCARYGVRGYPGSLNMYLQCEEDDKIWRVQAPTVDRKFQDGVIERIVLRRCSSAKKNSRFVSVYEPSVEKRGVKAVCFEGERTESDHSSLKVMLADGGCDRILVGRKQPHQGQLGVIREDVEGDFQSAALVGFGLLEGAGVSILLKHPEVLTRIRKVDIESMRVELEGEGADGSFSGCPGQIVRFQQEGFSWSGAWKVSKVKGGFLYLDCESSLVLAAGRVAAFNDGWIYSSIPSELNRDGYFNGRWILVEGLDEPVKILESGRDRASYRVKDDLKCFFKPGRNFSVVALGPGDKAAITHSAWVMRMSDGGLECFSTTEANITINADVMEFRVEPHDVVVSRRGGSFEIHIPLSCSGRVVRLIPMNERIPCA